MSSKFPSDFEWPCLACHHPASSHGDDGRCLFMPGSFFTMRLVKRRTLKRSEFHVRQDYLHAVQVWQLAKLALDAGAKAYDVRAKLEENTGGFVNWDFLWEK